MIIPIVSGIYTDSSPSIRTSYPVNLIPVVGTNGVSDGHLRPADGLVSFATGTGVDRGGILWDGIMYRVMGSKLVSVSTNGTVTTLGDVGNNGGDVSLSYSFDNLIISSNGNLFYWNGTTLTQVTDVDLGTSIDSIWVDGYTMSTDGEFIVVTELNDPTSVLSFKYNSAEVDPDPIKGLMLIRNEPHAIGRYTIEVFRNVGGSLFPFQRITGGHITKGAVGVHAICEYKETMIFVGGGRNEQVSVHRGVNGRTEKISTREVDEILASETEANLEKIIVEYRTDRSSDLIYIHLSDRTLVYDPMASEIAQQPIWCVLTSSSIGYSKYRAKNFVYFNRGWYFGDPTSSSIGYFDTSVSSHFGEKVRWEFGTQIIHNSSRGVIFSELELVALTGSVALGSTPTISTSYSLDGQTWSQDQTINAGTIGDRLKRLVWRRQGKMDSMRMQRFRGDSSSHISFLRLEAIMEPLGR